MTSANDHLWLLHKNIHKYIHSIIALCVSREQERSVILQCLSSEAVEAAEAVTHVIVLVLEERPRRAGGQQEVGGLRGLVDGSHGGYHHLVILVKIKLLPDGSLDLLKVHAG